MSVQKIDLKSLPWKPIRDGVEQRAVMGDDVTMAWHRLMPGLEPRTHEHSYQQIIYVVDGEMDMTIDGEVFQLRAGEMVIIPPNTRHHGTVVGTAPAFNLEVYMPNAPKKG